MEIPKEYIEVCKDFGKVARKHGLSRFQGEFQPPLMENRQIRKITFNWDSGRHNAETGVINIHADTWLTTSIDDK